MRFTLRQLEYVVTAAETGSVTIAAQRLHAAQSSVSSAIGQLERSLGVTLLIRHHAQGVTATPQGREFLREARLLIRQADELERLAADISGALAGSVDVGCLVTVAPIVAPRLAHSFEQANPGAQVRMVECGQAELLQLLRTGDLSFAVTYDLEIGPDVAFEPLAALPPHALVAADSPLAGHGELSLAELASEPLVLLDLPLSREYFRGLFAAAGIEPRIGRRSPHLDVIRSLVANGYGYTIVNAIAANDLALDGMPLRAVPIAGGLRPMTLGIASVEGVAQTRIGRAFREHAREVVHDWWDEGRIRVGTDAGH